MRLRVLGVGNLLQGDDGIGVRMAQELSRRTWPPEVEILEVGTLGGPHLVGLLEEAEAAVIIDAADFGGTPGEVRQWIILLERETADGWRGAAAGELLDPHTSSVLPALLLARTLGINIPVRILGIQPGSLQPGIGLSPELERAKPRLLECLEQSIEELLGLSPRSLAYHTNNMRGNHGQDSDY